MKPIRIICYTIIVFALVGVVTGHPWHLGTMALSGLFALTCSDDGEETAGRR